eukprot:CAMPEP_0203639196 /NCGR_PEP_ID=MMETSP0088-20131115/5015_1 /ASSEMBLY_ACC=CAM_ASM_001087 /TAXON_ID=426623 /ORGANISM="Chaetoceros affinis, Strain CCMP159" /LENGTH=227 /DNA_ID=CAMNT_0050494025 /DNA_START=464 /DNA_END=1148 /DNA_ORIENTATION=+
MKANAVEMPTISLKDPPQQAATSVDIDAVEVYMDLVAPLPRRPSVLGSFDFLGFFDFFGFLVGGDGALLVANNPPPSGEGPFVILSPAIVGDLVLPVVLPDGDFVLRVPDGALVLDNPPPSGEGPFVTLTPPAPAGDLVLPDGDFVLRVPDGDLVDNCLLVLVLGPTITALPFAFPFVIFFLKCLISLLFLAILLFVKNLCSLTLDAVAIATRNVISRSSTKLLMMM